MKKIIISAFAILSIVSFSSCLKDKDFDNKRFGTIVEEIKAVSFPEAVGGTFDCGGSVGSGYQIAPLPNSLNSQTTPQTLTFTIALEGSAAASSPVAIQINANNGLVTNYVEDCATGKLTVLASSQFSYPSTVTIPAGARTANFDITFPNSSTLDLAKKYGLGFSMTSVSSGYQIVANKKDILVSFGIKNRWDGVYTATTASSFVDVTNATFTGRYPLTYQLVTTGPTTCDVKMDINGELTPGYLFSAGGAGSFFGSWGITMYFDAATNAITEVRNYYGVTSNATTGVGTPSTGSGAPLYAASNTRRAGLDASGSNAYIPATKAINVKYFMYQPSIAATAPSGIRGKFDEKLTYLRAR